MAPDSGNAAREANQLYWETEVSVADIADRLGLSRRGLYEVVRPAPAGAPCPACGSDLMFTNRLARSTGSAACPACGREEALESVEAEEGLAADTGLPPDLEQELDAARMSPLETDAALARARALSLGGALLTGVIAGALAALLFGPRRRP